MKIDLMVSTASKKLIGFLLILSFLFHLPATPVVAQDIQYHTNYVNSVEWNSDGSILASGSTDQTIMLVNQDGSFNTFKKSTIGPNGSVLDVTWHINKTNQLFSSDVDQNVFAWDSNSSITRPTHQFNRHNGFIQKVIMDPRSNDSIPVLLSGGDGSNVRYYAFNNPLSDESSVDFVTYDTIGDHDSGATINGLDFSGDGEFFATADSDGNVRFYDVPELGFNNITLSGERSFSANIKDIDITENGQQIVIVSTDSVSVYTINNNYVLTQLGSTISVNCDESCLRLDVELSPDGEQLAVATNTRFAVYPFNNLTGIGSSATFSLDTVSDLGFEDDTTKAVAVGWHPDNNQLALAAGADVLNYDTTTGEQLFRIQGEIPETSNIVFIVGVILIIAVVAIWIIRRQMNKGKI